MSPSCRRPAHSASPLKRPNAARTARLLQLEVPLHHPEVHRPAIARDPIMLRLLGPPAVVEPHLGDVARALELEADLGPDPLVVRAGELELEGLSGLASLDDRAPVVLWPEREPVLRAEPGL